MKKQMSFLTKGLLLVMFSFVLFCTLGAEKLQAADADPEKEEERALYEQETLQQSLYQVELAKTEHADLYFCMEEDFREEECASFAAGEHVQIFAALEGGYEIASARVSGEDGEEVTLNMQEEQIAFFMPAHKVRVEISVKESAYSPEQEAEDQKQIQYFAHPNKEEKIALKVGKSVKYGSYSTHKYTTGQGSYAYCLNPKSKAPKTGSYRANRITDPILAKAAYYAYGGAGYELFREKVGSWGDGSENQEYAMSHVMLSYIYADRTGGSTSRALKGLSKRASAALKAKINRFRELPEAPKSAAAYLIKTSGSNGNKNAQMMLALVLHGRLQLQKESAQPTLSSDNHCYNLKGAEYGIYNAYREKVATLITDESGNSKPSEPLAYGSYMIREEKAAKGYALNEKAESVVIQQNQQVIKLKVSDFPQVYDVDLLMRKIDAETREGKAQGAASLQGAVFSVLFYDGYYTSPKELEEREALRSWTLVTDAKGEIHFCKEALQSGDAFFADADGKICMPLGTLLIREIKASDGYLLNGDDFMITMQEKENSREEKLSFTQQVSVPQQVKRGDLSLVKVEENTQKRLAGIPFSITSKTSGESHTVVTDENGCVNTSADWILHSQNTNRGSSKEDGIWFGSHTVNDQKGALLYDVYLVKELPCEANRGMELLEMEVTIKNDGVTLPMGTLTNHAKKNEKADHKDHPTEKKKRETFASPKTSDQQNVVLLILLMILSCAAIFTCVRIARKD